MAGQEKSERTPRSRNAAASRAAILSAARACFTRDGYGDAGLRGIAADAGVDPALVIRYFGSKERLFAEAVAQGFDLSALLAGGRDGFGERLARYLLSKNDHAGAAAFDPLVALLRSAGNEQAAGPFRQAVDEQFIRPLADWLGGDQPAERAGLIAAYLLGLALGRDILRLQSLSGGEIEPLVALVAPAIQSYVDGTVPIAPPTKDSRST